MSHFQTLSLDLGQHWHQGARREQQDYFATTNLEDLTTHRGFLAVVADGMGGHASGAEASTIAIHHFVTGYQAKSPEESIPTALRRALDEANHAVFVQNDQQESNMGTTLVATVVQDNQLYWVSVGDSSLFWYNADGELLELNEKHSYGSELDSKVKNHLLSPEEAHTESPKRHQLTSHLGLEQIPAVDWATYPRELKAGEKLLLCSDGLVNTLSVAEITESVASVQEAQKICEELVEKALAKGYSNQDNITVILLALQEKRLPQSSDLPAMTWQKPSWAILIGTMVLIGVILGVIIYLFSGYGSRNEAPPPPAAEHPPSPVMPVSSAPLPPPDTSTRSPIPNHEDLKWDDCKPVDSSLDLKKVQELLLQQETKEYREELGGRIGKEKLDDGKPGPSTELAIRRYQGRNGLTNTGFLNKETCEKLAQRGDHAKGDEKITP